MIRTCFFALFPIVIKVRDIMEGRGGGGGDWGNRAMQTTKRPACGHK